MLFPPSKYFACFIWQLICEYGCNTKLHSILHSYFKGKSNYLGVFDLFAYYMQMNVWKVVRCLTSTKSIILTLCALYLGSFPFVFCMLANHVTVGNGMNSLTCMLPLLCIVSYSLVMVSMFVCLMTKTNSE